MASTSEDKLKIKEVASRSAKKKKGQKHVKGKSSVCYFLQKSGTHEEGLY